MKAWIVSAFLFAATLSPLFAEERGGLLVDVQKISVDRNDKREGHRMSIDRMMALKIDVRNNSMRELPETTVNYVVLVERWNTETGRIERFEGSEKLGKLLGSQGESVTTKEFHIGGHMHGTSDRHVDHIEAWKVTINREGQNIDFVSGSNFDMFDKRSQAK